MRTENPYRQGTISHALHNALKDKFCRGDIVKYSNPIDADEENTRFCVLESHEYAVPPRVHVKVMDSHWVIGPIEVLSPDEICAS